MLRILLMLALCVAVIGTMGGVLVWFFRRLGKIEEERWGKRVGLGRPAFLSRYMERRRAKRSAQRPGTGADLKLDR